MRKEEGHGSGQSFKHVTKIRKRARVAVSEQKRRDLGCSVGTAQMTTSSQKRKGGGVRRLLSPSLLLSLSLSLLLLLLVSTFIESAHGAKFKLAILFTSQIRGKVFPVNKYGSRAEMDSAFTRIDCKRRCKGGAASRITYIKKVRSAYNHTLLLDAGASFAGSMFFYKYKGSVSAEFASLASYDALSLSGTDFWKGPGGASNFLKGVSTGSSPTPASAANLDIGTEPMLTGQRVGELGPMITPYSVVQVKVGWERTEQNRRGPFCFVLFRFVSSFR